MAFSTGMEFNFFFFFFKWQLFSLPFLSSLSKICVWKSWKCNPECCHYVSDINSCVNDTTNNCVSDIIHSCVSDIINNHVSDINNCVSYIINSCASNIINKASMCGKVLKMSWSSLFLIFIVKEWTNMAVPQDTRIWNKNMYQLTRGVISAWKPSQKHSNKDLSHLCPHLACE